MDYPCVLCDRHFGTKKALLQHQQNSPTHKKTVHCDTCDRHFRSKEALNQHRQNAPVHKTGFYCQACNDFLSSKRALQTHSRNYQLYQSCSGDPPDSPEPTTETREFFMFPALHENVAEAVLPEISSTWFHDDEDDDKFHHDYLTHVMGRFTCNNGACKTKLWVSKKVPIEIRGYRGNGYNAVVYNQRCRRCNFLGSFVLDEQSYIERVAYRLKKWAGVTMAAAYYKPKRGKPHERDFCEGCKRGKCREGNLPVVY